MELKDFKDKPEGTIAFHCTVNGHIKLISLTLLKKILREDNDEKEKTSK